MDLELVAEVWPHFLPLMIAQPNAAHVCATRKAAPHRPAFAAVRTVLDAGTDYGDFQRPLHAHV
jgi:hypothetical protein